MSKKYFCSSDIHSFYDEWMNALSLAGFDKNNPEHIIVVCGDLFDRGPKSVECLKFAKQFITLNRFIYVRGNHEDLLRDCLLELGWHSPSRHHISNGTVKTVSQFMGKSEYDVLCKVFHSSELDTIKDTVLKYIDDNAVDYFELGNTIFTHGWLPTDTANSRITNVDPEWRSGNWGKARWDNGMESWRFDITLPEKTIVCGHWHTSYGHCKINRSCETEFGEDAIFTPFIENGIVALDGCVAYTKKVNVVIFDEEGHII